MNKLIIIACCLVFAGCITTGPVQKRTEKSRIAEADFRDAKLADLIVFIVEEVNRPAPLHVSIGLIQKSDPKDNERKQEQFPELYRLCEDKTINLNAKNGSLLKLLDFVASCANLNSEFRNDHLVIINKDGKVIMK